jgi:predicted metal-dependent peptidase
MEKEEIKNLITGILLKDTLIGLLLKRTWIYADPNLPLPAGTDGLRIYINPRLFDRYDTEKKMTILAHEIMHIVQKHPVRQKQILQKLQKDGVEISRFQPLINIVADAKANQYLSENFVIPERMVTPERITKLFHIKNFERKSFEEVFDEIYKRLQNTSQLPKMPKVPADISVKGQGDSQGGQQDENKEGNKGQSQRDQKQGEDKNGRQNKSENKEGNGDQGNGEQNQETNDKKAKKTKGLEVLNEGDKEDLESNDLEKRIEKKVVEVTTSLRLIGKEPGDAERLISEILKPKVDWRKLLSSAITKGLGRKVRRTWSRPSRKSPLFPGKDLLKNNEVVVLVDTSGSIQRNELQQFLGEIYAIAKDASKITVIPWDAKAYEPIAIKRYSDIKSIKLRGGGGTRIAPALELFEKNYKNANVLVIFSDWDIGDLFDVKVQRMLKAYANKIIAVTVADSPPSFLKSIKIS